MRFRSVYAGCAAWLLLAAALSGCSSSGCSNLATTGSTTPAGAGVVAAMGAVVGVAAGCL